MPSSRAPLARCLGEQGAAVTVLLAVPGWAASRSGCCLRLTGRGGDGAVSGNHKSGEERMR
jgi:hypothetical protein